MNDNNLKNINNEETQKPKQNHKKIITCLIVLLIFNAILAIVNIILNIMVVTEQTKTSNKEAGQGYSKVDENHTNNQDDFTTTGHGYGKPQKADDIESVYISYGENGKNRINIFNHSKYHDEENSITRYEIDNEGNFQNRVSKTLSDDEVLNILKYIFDNDLKYLNDYGTTDDGHIISEENIQWKIAVNTRGASCMAYGDNEAPEWFNELLTKLDAN